MSGTAVLRRDYRWGALGVVAAGGIGVSSVLYPVPTAAGATVVCSFVYALVLRRHLPGMFLVTLGLLLLGYASLGRGFAYLGMAPVYVGEMTLAFGLVATALSGQVLQVFRSPVAWLIVALSGWCALQTIRYVPQYGVDALRDAAEWGYGVFALMVAACMLAQPRWEQLLGWFRRCMPYLLVWIPLAWIIVRGADDLLPVVPGTDVKLVVFNHALASVHLAGAAAFTLLGLGASLLDGRNGWSVHEMAADLELVAVVSHRRVYYPQRSAGGCDRDLDRRAVSSAGHCTKARDRLCDRGKHAAPGARALRWRPRERQSSL